MGFKPWYKPAGINAIMPLTGIKSMLPGLNQLKPTAGINQLMPLTGKNPI